MICAKTVPMNAQADSAGPPSKALWARETAAWIELGAYFATLPWWWVAPRGDGHPVLVLPGLIQSDLSTQPLRSFLRARGYSVSGWGLGVNSGRSGLVDESLVQRLHSLHHQHGRKVSLIGWSMGGLFARDLARQSPDSVRQVITLGSPFAGAAKASNVWRLYEALSGERAGDPEIVKRFRGPLKVPTTAVYSPRDGIVAWECCVNEPGLQVENIAVTSTHFGMGHHPAALYAIADRLAQPEGQWKPFAPPNATRWIYPARA